MDTYINRNIDKIRLKNQSGTVCSLECYYKVNKEDTPKRMAGTDKFPVGQEKTLDLNSLNIPEGALVTAFANIRSAGDSYGDVWFVYKKNINMTAEYVLSGVANATHISYNGIDNQYLNARIDKIVLDNQSGTICSLECYYMVNEGDSPKRVAGTGKFPVGQKKTLDLNTLNIPEDAWVTAFANVEAGSDCSGTTWLKYKNGCERNAEFTITGVINFTVISLDQIIPQEMEGLFEGYAIPVEGLSPLDHTYVHVTSKADEYYKIYPCWGRGEGGKVICSKKGNAIAAERIAGNNGNAGIVYLITGVCHQTANRILFPTKETVKDANGYTVSTIIYGVYGKFFNPDQGIVNVSFNQTYFDKVLQINMKYNEMEQTEENLRERNLEEVLVLLEQNTGNSNSIGQDELRSILKFKDDYLTDLNRRLESGHLSPKEHRKEINQLADNVAKKFATFMTDADYESFFGCGKENNIAIVDAEELEDA